MSNDGSSHLSNLTLDSLLLKGLSAEEERHARAHLAQCPQCAQRLAETHTSAEHFQRELQPQLVEQLRERLARAPPPSRSRWPWVLGGVLALAVALLAFALWRS